MNIDTEFNVGDSVCYLSGDNTYKYKQNNYRNILY